MVSVRSLSRPQSLGEEIANAVSHGAGALMSLAALPVLLVHSAGSARSWVEIFAATVFGASVVTMYTVSTLYHALPARRPGLGITAEALSRTGETGAKRVFRILDHCAIYVLIAGTYTPFALGAFRDDWGWPMFCIVWGLAAGGIVLKAVGAGRHPVVSSGLYLAMGWLVLAAADPLFEVLPAEGFRWLLAGGLAYTVGVVFFALDGRWRYAHLVWHLLVLAGTACHFIAVLGYA